MSSDPDPPLNFGSMPWTRREVVKALAAAGVAGAMPGWLSSLSAHACSPAQTRPNILFIVADDHAYGGLSGYGGQLLDTPHLDRIAAEGVEFTNAFVTNSICSPSRGRC